MLRSVAQQTVTAGGITQLPGQQPELKHSMSTELITIEPTVKQLKQLKFNRIGMIKINFQAFFER